VVSTLQQVGARQAMTLRVFIGVDKRQPLSYTVCRHSIEKRASKRVSVEPIRIEWTPITRRGLTDFTFARYAVPYLCGYEGSAIFMDADILVLGDVYDLAKQGGKHPVTVQKGLQRFEWPSVMVFNNERCQELTPEYINNPNSEPQALGWAGSIGSLPAEWNHCVGYDKPAPAKLVHYTAGIPCWPETDGCEYSKEWHEELKDATSTVSWDELMGNSVHADMVKSGHLQRNGAING
jgi:hypothetical protein